nr:NAD-dependent epimerase/dehydratase family protein [Anaerolineae bacterium]
MIFVTGGTGFLGRHLIPALCREGYTVKVLTRTPDQHPWLSAYKGVSIIKGDLDNLDVLMNGVQGCDYIIHAGGLFRFWGDETNFMRTNAQGTHNILTAAASIPLKRFIHISTIAVIGHPHQTDVMDETYPPTPTDPYQHSKLQGEQEALRF